MIHGLKPSLAEAGKIKIGRKSQQQTKSGHRLPEKLDHFLITTNERDGAGDLVLDTDLMERLPKAPDGVLREIPIVLHSDAIDEVFPTRYARYAGRKLACHGDGERATVVDGAVSRDCPCVALERRECKPSGILHCSIRVDGRAVAGAVHKWRTTSIISIQQMVGSLIQIQQTVGVIQGVPLVLRVGPRSVAPDGKPTTVYVCWVELRAADLSAVQSQALSLAQQREAVRMAVTGVVGELGYQYRELVAPTPEEEQDIADEFYHDADAKADADVPPNGSMADVVASEVVATPQPTEHPASAVMRRAKLMGRKKSEIEAAVKVLKEDGSIPLSSDEWTAEDVEMILGWLK